MSVGAIIQARMTSKRFPGKVLHQVAGKPLLQYVLERLSPCTSLDAVVVATSVDQSDDPVEFFCREHGVLCFRGDLANVAGRLNAALRAHGFGAFVRLSGDSPLMDPVVVDRGVDTFLKGKSDLVTNVFPRSFPRGQSVEVLRADTFRWAVEMMRDSEDLEHVTRYYYRNPRYFKIRNFSAEQDYSGVGLAVDTTQDMERFAKIIASMDKPHWKYHLPEILAIYADLSVVGSQV